MPIESLEKLFIHELKDIYSAENQILKALPKMAKKATHPELRKAFEDHEKQTQGQVQRLERIFEELEASPRGKKCVGMEGLLEEGKEAMQEDMEDDLRDAAMIGAAQRVEHYEIAAYGTARTFAEQLGMSSAVKLLQETLEEESRTDERLSKLAERKVNQDAARS